MPYTQLSPLAIPGKRYSFTAKATAANLDGYRIEPIMGFGDPFVFKTLQQVWFGITEGGDYSIDLYWRGGDTAKEVEGESWAFVDSLNLNNPSNPVINTSRVARLHQLKWGTNGNDEKYCINWLKFKGYLGEE